MPILPPNLYLFHTPQSKHHQNPLYQVISLNTNPSKKSSSHITDCTIIDTTEQSHPAKLKATFVTMPVSLYTHSKTRRDRLPPLATSTSSSRSSTPGRSSDSRPEPRRRTTAEEEYRATRAEDREEGVQLSHLWDIRDRAWRRGDRSEQKLNDWRKAQKKFSERLRICADNMGSWRLLSWDMNQVNDHAEVVELGQRIEERQKELEYALKAVETLLEVDIEDMQRATRRMVRLTSGQSY